MASLLRKLRPVVPSVADDGDDYSYEYSFAMEYKGPPVTDTIPEAAPFKIDHIPIAAVAPSAVDEFSVPIIQPIVKTNRKSNAKLELRTDSVPYSNSESNTVEISRLGTTKSSSSYSLLPESLNRVNNTGSAGTAENDDNFRGNLSQRGLTSCTGESSGLLQVPDDDKQDRGFQYEMNPTNSDTTESGSNSHSDFSEICHCREDDYKNGIPRHVKRPSTVTFRDPELDDMVVNVEFDDSSQAASSSVRPRVERGGKKGTCYRCQKANRFTEKEVCLVCSAKYCRNCVIRAMGSMPEGRKCVTCIGHRIDENNRRTLGKCSRMLKHMMSQLEVEKIMDAEMFCEANRIPAGRVLVNRLSLDQEQLMLLLKCPNPPKKLKPGFYWYDKASGLWGKESHGPCQFISAHLDVGGHLKKNASNGNTNVFINDREITKKELRVMKVAGVLCEGGPNFWVSADGSYKEEGQRDVKGRIWDKTIVKLVCAILSLPVPSNAVNSCEEGKGRIAAIKDNPGQIMLHKFLLVGSSKSGTTTIFKQAKILYNVPFSEIEVQNIKLVIQSNLYTYLGILLEGRKNFEEQSLLEKWKTQLVDESTSSGNTGEITKTTIYSIGPKLKAFSDWLLQCMVSGNLDAIFLAATREYAPLVEELWKDPAIQATYNRRNELEMLPRGACYFLDRAVEISKVDYEPSDMDKIYAEGITLSNSLISMEFLFPESGREETSLPDYYQHDPSLRYQLIRVHRRSLGENCKRLEMFDDINVVVFCVALTDYDEYIININGVSTNKMLAAKHLFENVITHPTFNNKKFLLLLNKFDLLEEKIEVAPLTRCEWFCDFNPVNSNNPSNNNNPHLAPRAFQYIAVKFKRLFSSLTGKKLFVYLVTGLEPDTVDGALRYAREIMGSKKWDPSFLNERSENTSTSFEEASSS